MLAVALIFIGRIMAKISFKDWSRYAIIKFHKQYGSSLSEQGVTPLQILVAVLDHTPGFRDIPEVQADNWKPIFQLLSSMYNTDNSRGIRPSHSAVMQAAINFSEIPKPLSGGYSLRYLFVALREEAVKITADQYEVKDKKIPSFADFGIKV